MIGLKKEHVKRLLSLVIISGGVLFGLGLPQMVKADDADIAPTSDIQGLLNQNSAVIQNAPSTQSEPVNTIAPLASTITASGTFGTCNWDIDENGLLTIHAGVLGAGMGNWVTDGNVNDTITNVVCDPGVVANASSAHLFNGLKSVQTIDVNNMDTSNIIDMQHMFSVSYKNSTGLVQNNITLTKIIGLENLNTGKVEDMDNLFYKDTKLPSINVSGFDTSNVTNMSYMFYDNTNLTEIIGLDKFNTGKVVNFASMFYGVSNLTQLDGIENWDISNANTIGTMFSNMKKLKHLNLSNWNTSNVTDMSQTFYFCERLTELDGLKNWDTSKVTNMTGTFYGNTMNNNLHDVEGWDTSQVKDMSFLFDYCLNLDYIDLTNWDTSQVRKMNNMFSHMNKITKIIGIEKLNTSNVTNMHSMFEVNSIENLNLKSFDTSKVTDMASMFSDSMAKDISGDFDTSQVTSIQNIFYKSGIDDYNNLDLNVTDWNLSKCRDFTNAFNCNLNLQSIDLSKWDTRSVTNINYMFYADTNLKYINLSGWNTSNLTNMVQAFTNNSSLRELNLSNWDTSKVVNMGSIFGQDDKLWKITIGPKTKLVSVGGFGASYPTPPAKSTEIDDPNTDQKYYSISDKWQKVDPDNGGTDHDPAGKLYGPSEMDTDQRTDNTTYVWQQQPYIDVSMSVPDLSYGQASANQGIVRREQDNWAITFNNNVYPDTTLDTKISVNMESPLSDTNGDTLDNSFIFRDNNDNDSVIGTSPTLIYDGKVATGEQMLSWDSKHGFLMNLHDYSIQNGIYTTRLDWTMVNSV
ncbi:BspA family leucine-rich repeat surface protein [Companilactobacillus insicii]|uniref:BspA family leucine-rich repeat surface protein n=1 Tax=Companilactobacillus insicii TaxID=1732567 RepID=UPI000F77BF82|nr:BspA family leucine-rich repeat surface protein [Companilactobacillus insicii]